MFGPGNTVVEIVTADDSSENNGSARYRVLALCPSLSLVLFMYHLL